MKKTQFLILLTLFVFLNTCLPLCFAQQSTSLNLPGGAKARLGKGWMNELKYSPDGARLAVATSVGIWLYDTQTFQEVESTHGTCTRGQ